MSRMLKPVAAGLALGSLCLAGAGDLSAQSASKKKSAVQQTQAENDQPAVPRSRARSKSADDTDAAPVTQGKSGKKARPQVEPLRAEKLDPALEQILKDWELTTSHFKKLAGEFSRFKYDATFEVEIRANGKFAYEAPDKGYYELRGAVIDKADVSKKVGKDGIPFAIMSDGAERWVCTGKDVIRIYDKDKTYEKVPIPPESQGENMIDGPLPFLFGMKAEQAKLRYKLSLDTKRMKSNPSEIWLNVIPKWEKDAKNYQRATVIIEAKTFLPKAVKLVDPSGQESVHRFENLEVNSGGFIQQIFRANPFKPNLWTYKQVLLEKGIGRSPGEPPIAPSNAKKTGSAAAPGRTGASDRNDRELGPDVTSGDLPRKKSSTTVNRK